MHLGHRYARVVCADGFNMSVQANSGAYCTPPDNEGPYYQLEVGFPSARCATLFEYAEDPSKPTQTVYGYVPSDTILRCIEAHGGMVDGELPPMDLGTAYKVAADSAQ